MDPAGKAGTKFSDPQVRQAMSLAINRKAIADTAFAGLVKPLTSFWYDCPDICPTGMLPNGGVQDVEAAKELMTEAGVPAEGIYAEMLVSSTRGGWKEGATLVAADLEADRRPSEGHTRSTRRPGTAPSRTRTSSPSTTAARQARRSR